MTKTHYYGKIIEYTGEFHNHSLCGLCYKEMKKTHNTKEVTCKWCLKSLAKLKSI